MISNGPQSTPPNGIAAYVILPPNRSRTTATALPRKSLTRAGTCGINPRRRGRSVSSSIRSPMVSPGRNPLFIKLISAPVTSTTSAPCRRSRSARSAESARRSSISSCVKSHVNGENQTSRPASTARLEAISSRCGSPPVTRTALQCKSSWMICNSRLMTSMSNGSRLLTPLLMKPVS